MTTRPDLEEWEQAGDLRRPSGSLTYQWIEDGLVAMVHVVPFQPASWQVASVAGDRVWAAGLDPDEDGTDGLERMATAAWAALQVELTGCAECRAGFHVDCLRPSVIRRDRETGEPYAAACCPECRASGLVA